MTERKVEHGSEMSEKLQKREDELLHLRTIAHQTEDRIQTLKEAQRDLGAELRDGENPQAQGFIPSTGGDTREQDLNAKCAQVDAMLKLVANKSKRLREETVALDELKQELLEREKTCLQFEQALKDQEGQLHDVTGLVARQEQTLREFQQAGQVPVLPAPDGDMSSSHEDDITREAELVVNVRHNILCAIL